VLPTSPCPAPLLVATQRERVRVRRVTAGVCTVANLCGPPEVTLPAGTVGGAPVGLKFDQRLDVVCSPRAPGASSAGIAR